MIDYVQILDNGCTHIANRYFKGPICGSDAYLHVFAWIAAGLVTGYFIWLAKPAKKEITKL